MSEFGHMIVDWEQRLNVDRMRRERLEKVKAAMEQLDMDALLVCRTDYMRYLTGYRYLWPPVERVRGVRVVLPRGGEPILFTWEVEAARRRMPWMSPENIRPLAVLLGETGAPVLREAAGKVRNGRIGVDAWNPEMYATLPQVFPKATFVDRQEVFSRASLTKTQDEIECIKAAYTITEAGMDAALASLKPGVRECEVLAVAWGEMTRLGSEWFQCSNIVASGPSTMPYRRLTSDRIIQKGDLVIIDIGGCYNGYWGDLTRTWLCGDVRPSPEQIKLHQACYDSLFAACAASRPGNTTADVVRAAEPNILEDDVLGHGAGVCPWEPPFFTHACLKSPMNLEPGMAFNLEPYTGKLGVGGFRLENNLLVTEAEPDIFSTYPCDGRLLREVHPLDTTTAKGGRP